MRIGLFDAAFGATADAFQALTRAVAECLAQQSDGLLEQKYRGRARDEQLKPLQAYRNGELARSHECFFGPDRSYHEARRRYCHKLGGARTFAPRAENGHAERQAIGAAVRLVKRIKSLGRFLGD